MFKIIEHNYIRMFQNPAVLNVDEVMKYSVQYTKLCLGKSDLVISFPTMLFSRPTNRN
jgi:hypothetical protein